MKDELEKRLRDLWLRTNHDQDGMGIPRDWHEMMREAARIGAEIEREACAQLAERMFQEADWDFPDDFPAAIRARGGK